MFSQAILKMTESTYKLLYFDIRGMAECVRYMFAYADVEFEDCRISREEWPAIKEGTYKKIDRHTTPMTLL